MTTTATKRLSCLAIAVGILAGFPSPAALWLCRAKPGDANPTFLAGPVAGPAVSAAAEAPPVRKRREPPPAVIPTEELQAAKRMYERRNYQGAVAQAKAALNKNERYTPAMLVMARAYFKLGKYEWVKTLGDMMKNAGASEAERSDIYQMMAFMEVESCSARPPRRGRTTPFCGTTSARSTSWSRTTATPRRCSSAPCNCSPPSPRRT
jgi:hypothetical protein